VLPSHLALCLKSHKFTTEITSKIKDLEEIISLIDSKDIEITIDPLELSGQEYYSGVAFSVFLQNKALEIGKGGRYITDDNTPACGFTLYVDDLL